MPNPLLSAFNRAQLSGKREPVAIEPRPEEYTDIDYQGLGEMDEPEGPQNYTGPSVPVVVDPAPKLPDPIAVSLVNDETRSREFTEWGGYVSNVDGNTRQIVSRDRRRLRVKVKNMHASVGMWIGPTVSVARMGGIFIAAGQTEELTSIEAVYGISDDPNVMVNVNVLSHWSVNVDK